MGEAAHEVRGMTSAADYVASLPQDVRRSLRASGLCDDTIYEAGIRRANPAELPKNTQLAGLDGYAIPFFDVRGKLIKNFVRIRLLHQALEDDQKYQQPANVGQHAYLPPMLDPVVWSDPSYTIMITEGEKKALKAVQEGLVCIALTGVASWHSRTYEVPKAAAHESGKKLILQFKDESDINIVEHICEELRKIVWAGRRVIICFDTDKKANPLVQNQAFELALWLDQQGAEVQQLYLPANPGEKVGLDDYLCEHSVDELKALMGDSCTFPTVPNIRQWIIRQKAQTKERKALVPKIARAVIANLDRHGKRFYDPDAMEYYYLCDAESGELDPGLYSFRLTAKAIADFRNKPIGSVLLRDHQLSTTDSDILSEVADRFALTRPINAARPRRVCYTKDDDFYFQTSDTALLKVSAHNIDEVRNGHDGMLFRSGTVKPLDMDVFWQHFDQGYQRRWLDAMQGFYLRPQVGLDRRQTELLLAALFYLSPWLRQWRGMMCPVEQVAAEASSGKTFLYNLRRGILTGKPSLDGLTKEFKDWVANVTDAPAIWVCDNVNEVDYKLRVDVENNVARLVTDPDPHVDARILYTDNEQARYPIDCAFAVTAIQVPFRKHDVIQRSFIYHMGTIPVGERDGDWYKTQIAMREAWIAEQIWVTQQFLQVVEKQWQRGYRSSHRLVHLEQAMLCMLRVLGVATDEALYIVRSMPQTIDEEIVQSSDAMEVLREFALAKRREGTGPFTAQDILQYVDWSGEDFSKVAQFKNSIAFGHWTAQNETILRNAVGLVRYKAGEQTYYRVLPHDKMVTEGS